MRRFQNIPCVMKSEIACQCAIEHAVALAESNQARVTVVTVTEHVPESIRIPGGGSAPGDMQGRSMNAMTQWLESLNEPYRARIEINAKVLVGTSFLEIIESRDWVDRFFAGDDMHLLKEQHARRFRRWLSSRPAL